MKIIHSKKTIETLSLKPFTPIFNEIFLSFDEDTIKNYNEDYEKNIQFSEKNIKKIFDVINYSWDGEIYFFKNEDKEKVLNYLNKWFAIEENHKDIDDYGISNCFLIKESPNGFALIDTQLDMSSNITSFFEELEKINPGIDYTYYSDCHLIDNIHLGRDSINNEFETLFLLYKEQIIDSSFFLNGLYDMEINDSTNEHYNLISQDKEIALTGKMSVSREHIISTLNDLGIKTTEKITNNTWLWTGDKVGEEKLKKAKSSGAKISSIDEIITNAFNIYLENKKKLMNT